MISLIFENEYTGTALPSPLPFSMKETAMAVAARVLEAEECPYEAEVNLTLTDDAEIREINRETRGIDRATDVLSFPVYGYEHPGAFSEAESDPAGCFHPESGRLLLGDIMISADRMAAQAEEYGHSLKREFAFLVAHSMLHLIGYDHMSPEEERLMTGKQEEILGSLGITRNHSE